MASDEKVNNKTSRLRAFCELYIGPNDSRTGHSVLKLWTKQLLTTPKCKPVPLPEDVIQVVNEMGRQEGMPDGIQFHNKDKESTLSDLYTEDDSQDDNSCASNNNWRMEENAEKTWRS